MQHIPDPEVDLGIRKVPCPSRSCESLNVPWHWAESVLRQGLWLQKVVYGVSAGAVATLFVMVPYILWPF